MIGKEQIYVWEVNERTLHENDAAAKLAEALAGKGVLLQQASEGKVEMQAIINGLLKINVEALEGINSFDEIAVATLHTNQIVRTGTKIAGCKVIPLVIEVEKIQNIQSLCSSVPSVNAYCRSRKQPSKCIA